MGQWTWSLHNPLSHLRNSCPITDLNADTAVQICLFSDSTLCNLSSQAYCTGQQKFFESPGVRLIFIVFSSRGHGIQFEHLSYNHILINKTCTYAVNYSLQNMYCDTWLHRHHESQTRLPERQLIIRGRSAIHQLWYV